MTNHLLADEPSDEPEQDLLGRGKLVEVFGAHLVTLGDRSVVLAIHGRWGVGKTSFLHLLERWLKARISGENEPVVLWFNPWFYQDSEQLVRRFCEELGGAIGKGRTSKVVSAVLDFGDAIAGDVADVLVLPGGRLIAGALRHANKKRTENRKTLRFARDELRKALKVFPRHVFVFVDDLDRLERDAIREMFRLIRLVSEFPQITFLMAFDRDVVEAHLDQEGSRGRDYLDKLIQVSYDLPEPDEEAVQAALVRKLAASAPSFRELFAFAAAHDRAERWQKAQPLLRAELRTLRDTKRYVNGLRLAIAGVVDEVDPVDFALVELLRARYPEVYREVARKKQLLAPTEEDEARRAVQEKMVASAGLPPAPPEKPDDQPDAVLAKLDAAAFKRARSILAELFPRRFLPAGTDAGSFPIAKDPRVSAEGSFGRYFRLAVPPTELSAAEWRAFESLLSATHDTALDEVRARLEEARAASRLPKFLRRFRDRVEASLSTLSDPLSDDAAERFMRAVLRLGDDVFTPISHDLGEAIVAWVSSLKASGQPNGSRRFLDSLTHAELLPVVAIVDHMSVELMLGDAEDQAAVPEVVALASAHLEAAARGDILWSHPSFRWLFWAYWRLTRNRDDPARMAFVKQHTDTDEALVAFMERIDPRSSGRPFDLSVYPNLFPPEVLERLAVLKRAPGDAPTTDLAERLQKLVLFLPPGA